MNVDSIIATASNRRGGDNPPFVLADFFAFYPQFENLTELPTAIVETFIAIADSIVKQNRWHSKWIIGMNLYVAHYCTLYLKTALGSTNAEGVYASGLPQGLITASSVGDVSKSVDYSMLAEDLKGWGDFKQSIYGQQYVTNAKLLGKGGMGVW